MGVATKENEQVVNARERMRGAESAHFREDRILRRKTAKAAGLPHRTIVLPPGPAPQINLDKHFPRVGLWRCMRKSQCDECKFGTCRTSEDETRKTNQCPCHRGERCQVWDTSSPCRTSFEEVPPSSRALALAEKAGTTPSTSTVGSVDADSLLDSITRLENSTLELAERIKDLISSIEEQERDREVTIQHIKGLNVTELLQKRNEILANMDEAIEEAKEQVASLRAVEDQDLGDEEEVIEDQTLPQSHLSNIFRASAEEGGANSGEDVSEVLSTEDQRLKAGEQDIRLLESLKRRERTVSKVTMAGSLALENRQTGEPAGATWLGYTNLSPASQERWQLQDSARSLDKGQKDTGAIEKALPTENMGLKESSATTDGQECPEVQEERRKVQDMSDTLQQLLETQEEDVAAREKSGQAQAPWIKAKMEVIEKLELRSSTLGQALESFARLQKKYSC